MRTIEGLYLAENEEERIIWYQTGHKGAPSGESGAYGPAKMTINSVI